MERFPHGATFAGRVTPEDLSEAEQAGIQEGTLGYCEGHLVLYQKQALSSCLVPLVFEDGLGRQCKEWSPAHQT